jgi:hypothetical protein
MLYGERVRNREGERKRMGERETGRDSDREGESKTGKEGERVRERCRICPELFIFKRNDRCLGTF